MATTSQTLSPADGWVQVAASSDTGFLVENAGSNLIIAQFAASPPAAGAGGHILDIRDGLTRFAPGNLYVRAEGPTSVVVSK